MAVSGLPTGRFTFEGFLTVNKKSRRERLEALRTEERTMIFHEAPHKLRGTLADLCGAFGAGRRVALCREMTKLHEETLRMTLGEAVAYYGSASPRGEYVLVVEGAAPEAAPADSMGDAVREVLELRDAGTRLKEAAARVADRTGFPKNQLYAAALRQMDKE